MHATLASLELLALLATLELPAHVAYAHPLDRFPVANYAGEGLPALELGGRVLELFDGEHLDILLRDTPGPMRPPSLVAFYGHESCPSALSDLEYQHHAETLLPARERLLITKYNMDAASKRSWYEWTPERDLAKRYNVTSCPTLAFVPRQCNGWTKWCEREKSGAKTVLGCEGFTEQCSGVVHWDGKGSWLAWATALIAREGDPQLDPVVGTFQKQGAWLVERDESTSSERARTYYMPPAVPSFSPTGYKQLPTPPEIQKWLKDFYHGYKDKGKRKIEPWSAGLTQNSFHETPMYQVDLDMEMQKKTEIGDRYLKPLLEEWTNVSNLEVTSIYGVREYYEGHWLANHIDREDTHVISATFCIEKMPFDGDQGSLAEHDPWPLEFTDWNGQRVRYEHPPGTVILYESVKGIHGRPYHNPHSGGIHVGAFFHYRPPTTHMDWAKVAKEAKSYLSRKTKRVRYKASPSVEPKTPVLTSFRYGEGARFHEHEAEQGVHVEFANLGPDPLTLFWRNDDIAVAQCSPVVAGSPCSFSSFPGHRFFWTLAIPDIKPFESRYEDSEIPAALPGSTFVVRKGKTIYNFEYQYDEL